MGTSVSADDKAGPQGGFTPDELRSMLTLRRNEVESIEGELREAEAKVRHLRRARRAHLDVIGDFESDLSAADVQDTSCGYVLEGVDTGEGGDETAA
jgi:hypothetical protein